MVVLLLERRVEATEGAAVARTFGSTKMAAEKLCKGLEACSRTKERKWRWSGVQALALVDGIRRIWRRTRRTLASDYACLGE